MNLQTSTHLTELTLNNGRELRSPQGQIPEEIISTMSSICDEGGGHACPFDFQIEEFEDGGAIVVVRGPKSEVLDLALFGVAWTKKGAARVWQCLDGGHGLVRGMVGGEPQLRPKSLPWSGAVILPSAINEEIETLELLGDFQRCLSWVLIERAALEEGVA